MVAAAAVAPAAAVGQDIGGLEQRGIRTGTLNIFPSIAVSTGYNDNVLAAPEDAVGNQAVISDIVTIVSPEVRVETNTQRHGAFITGGASLGRYEDLDGQDFDDFFVDGGARWDVSRTFSITGNLRFANDHESAEDPDRSIEQLRETNEINRYSGSLQLNKRGERGFVRLRTAVRKTRYDELGSRLFPTVADLDNRTSQGVVNVNEGRDVDVFPTSLRVGYSVDRDFDAFVDLGYRATRYEGRRPRLIRWNTQAAATNAAEQAVVDTCRVVVATGQSVGGRTVEDCLSVKEARPGSGGSRDFDTYTVRLGTAVDIDRLVTGEFSVGLQYRSFEDPESDSGLGLSFAGGLDFSLSPRTALSVNAAQGFEPAADGSTLATTLGTRLTFTPTRKSQLGANLNYSRDDRDDSERSDETFRGGLFASYTFNRYLSVGANYAYTQRFSTEQVREYTQNTVFVFLRGQY